MILPHFEVVTFASQLFWLAVAAGITYGFNKLFFIPLISSSISKRQEIIKNYKADIDRLEKEITNVKAEIELVLEKGKIEAKNIIDQAVSKSQAQFLESLQRSNQNLSKNMSDYDEYLENHKDNLSKNMRFVIDDIKDKVSQLISMQNI